MLFAGIATVINSTLCSSLPSNAVEFIAQDFNVQSETQLVLPISCFLFGYVIGPILCGPASEHWGRKRIILSTFVCFIIFNMACAVAPSWSSFLAFRFLTGIVASGPIAIVPGLYADVYSDPRQRGTAMAVFMTATSCGPLFAPPISGFIGQTSDWRWVFAFGTFFALATLPALVFMPESYLPVLLSRRAKKMRKETGNPNIIAVTDLQKKSIRYILTVVMTRPYRMLFQEAIVACVTVYATLTYAIFYLYFQGKSWLIWSSESHSYRCSIPRGLSRSRLGVQVLAWHRRSDIPSDRCRCHCLRTYLPVLGQHSRPSRETAGSLGVQGRIPPTSSCLRRRPGVCDCDLLVGLVRQRGCPLDRPNIVGHLVRHWVSADLHGHVKLRFGRISDVLGFSTGYSLNMSKYWRFSATLGLEKDV